MPVYDTKEQADEYLSEMVFPAPYVDFIKVENVGRKERRNSKGETKRWPERTRYFRLYLVDSVGSPFAWIKENLDQVRAYMRRFKAVGFGNFTPYYNDPTADVQFVSQLRQLELELGSHLRTQELELENAALRAKLGGKDGKANGNGSEKSVPRDS